jgi:hypothetical protein
MKNNNAIVFNNYDTATIETTKRVDIHRLLQEKQNQNNYISGT